MIPVRQSIVTIIIGKGYYLSAIYGARVVQILAKKLHIPIADPENRVGNISTFAK